MSAVTIAIDRPACAVCAAWKSPCAACLRDAEVIPNELIEFWNHGLLTSGGLGSTLAPCQGMNHQQWRAALKAREQRILETLRGEPVTLRERLSDESRAAVGA